MSDRRGGRLGEKLVIVQPYVPQYRVRFFELLRESLAKEGIELAIHAGVPRGELGKRSDAVTAPWITTIPRREVKVGERALVLSYGGEWGDATGVIVASQGTSLETYRAILGAKLGRFRVGVWGHIKDYVHAPHPLDSLLERWQLRNVDQVFAYTPGGAAHAIKVGVAEENVTTVMNTIDTATLREQVQSVTTDELASFMNHNKLRPGRTLAFVGGLDSAKRIDFLAEALDYLFGSDPDVRVLLGGTGAEEARLGRAITRGQVVKLGYVDEHLKALIGRAASAMVMPGRIGLVAVDCLQLRIPIITTAWRFHAPEAEYLEEGISRITSIDDPASYAAEVSSFLRQNSGSSARLSNQEVWAVPTQSEMVSNFTHGVLRMLGKE